MTIQDARSVVENASVCDPEVIDFDELATAVKVLHERVVTLYNQAQCESARWLAANADRQFKSALEVALLLPLAELLTLMQPANTAPALGQTVSPSTRIGATLLRLIDALQEGLEHNRSRWESSSPDIRSRRIDGASLVYEDMFGKRSHRLSARPLHEGVTLLLLTSAGWIAGTFHTITGDPVFTFRVPGAAEDELTIPIPARALLAWSDD